MLVLKKATTIDVIALFDNKDDIKFPFADDYKEYCYFIPINLMVDYEERFLIIGIKANI